jgi:hypothetical protein
VSFVATANQSQFSPVILFIYILIALVIWRLLARRKRRKNAQGQAFQIGVTNLTMRESTPETKPPEYSNELNQSKIDALAKIAELRSKGILSEEEFIAQKKRILGA